MTKKLVSLALLLALVLSLVPATASASTLGGWTTKVDYANTDPTKYVIEVDVTNQILTVYEYALGGNIAVQGLCTTGDEEHPTGKGTFKLGDMKERFGYFVNFGQYAQYWSQVVRGIYIHSIMYNSKDTSTMSKSAYRNLGKNVSHGCIRVLPHIAQFIYYNCPPGTVCKVTAKEKNDALVKEIKSSMPSYANYKQPTDSKADPLEVPGVIRYNSTPIRTGSSKTNDTTIGTLSAGTHVMLVQLASDWCKVRTEDGKLGYVKTSNILAYPDEAIKTEKAYVSSEKTYVYSDKSTDSKKLVKIPKGALVTVYQQDNDKWFKGSYAGTEGYIRVSKLALKDMPVYPELTRVEFTDSSTGTSTFNARIKADIRANMRAEAGMAGAIIAVLDASTPVKLMAEEGSWYYCEANGMTGYISAVCLELVPTA